MDIGMSRTIDLNDNFVLTAQKIDNKRPNRRLPDKLEAAQSTVTKPAPKKPFGLGGCMSHVFRTRENERRGECHVMKTKGAGKSVGSRQYPPFSTTWRRRCEAPDEVPLRSLSDHFIMRLNRHPVVDGQHVLRAGGEGDDAIQLDGPLTDSTRA
jgi:hypothetical protein